MPAAAARMDQKVCSGATHEVHIEAQSAIAVGKIDAAASARLHRDSTMHVHVCVRHVRDVRAFVHHTRAQVAKVLLFPCHLFWCYALFRAGK